ncbi:MAG: hypothetical protein WD426_05595 [Anditalea sp.]
MKNHPLSILVLLAILLGCSNSSDNGKEQSNKELDLVQKNRGEELDRETSSCYLYATDRDTVFLELNPPVNGKVTGELNYLFYERDGNVGHIEGEIQGDTLLANYTFVSEGMTSVREVAFLLGGNQVMEGSWTKYTLPVYRQSSRAIP